METSPAKSSKAKLILESFTYGLFVFMPFYFYTTYYWKEVSAQLTFYCKQNNEIFKCSFGDAFYTYIVGLIVVAILISPFIFIFHKYKFKKS